MVSERVHHLIWDVVDHLALALGAFPNEVSDQQGKILYSFSQWWEVDGKHIQPVVEIRAECAFLDHTPEILVGGGDDAHVEFHCVPASEALDLLFLEDPE
jgi:hypothetical protein